MECPAMEIYRNDCDLGPFVRLYRSLKPQFSSIKIYAMYLSDRDPSKMKTRALALYSMKVAWHRLMNIAL